MSNLRFDQLRGQLPQELIAAMDQELESLDPVENTRYATKTTEAKHYYCDSDSGNDSNDGLTWDTAKKTLDGVRLVIPDIIYHLTIIHLKGTFDVTGYHKYDFFVSSDTTRVAVAGKRLVITGTDDKVEIVGTCTVSAASNRMATDGSKSWTTDDYAGYWVEILSGPCIGEVRTIQSNTSTQLVATRVFSASLQIGNTFRIVRPATTLTAPGPSGGYFFVVNSGPGEIVVEKLYFSGVAQYNVERSWGNVDLAACVSDSTASASYSIRNSSYCGLYGLTWNQEGSIVDGAIAYCPPSQRNIASKLSINSIVSGQTFQVVARKVTAQNVDFAAVGFFQGTRVYGGGLELTNVNPGGGYPLIRSNSVTGTYATTRFDGNTSGPGIKATRSYVLVDTGQVDIENNTHGIELNNSMLKVTTAGTKLAGTGNTGAGVYAYGNSVVQVKHGTLQTVTGTVGNLSVDGTTQIGTWADLEGAVVITDVPELTVMRELP
jgi:hypothetical protein